MILPALQLSALLPHTPPFPPRSRLDSKEQSSNRVGTTQAEDPEHFLGEESKKKKNVARSHSLTVSILPSCIRVRLATLRYLDFEEGGDPSGDDRWPSRCLVPGVDYLETAFTVCRAAALVTHPPP